MNLFGFILKSSGGANIATVTVRNIPDELYERLKSIAEINRRSINSEIIIWGIIKLSSKI